jgi:predicted dehydrogenase
LNAAEAESLSSVRKRTGVQIAEAFMVRTHPQWVDAMRMVRSGRIGGLHLINAHFSYFRRDPGDVRSRPDWGGGVLLDIGCYPITMSRWMFGEEPLEVVADLGFDPVFGVDRIGSAILRFPSGQATFTIAGQLALHQTFQLFGSKGRISFDIPFNPPSSQPARLTVDDGRDLTGGGAEMLSYEPVNQFTLQATQFSEAIRGRGAVAVPLEDAVRNMRVLDALFRSAHSRRWESLAS